MPIYKINEAKSVQQIKPKGFRSEKELQELFVGNLLDLLGVRYIGSEFTTGDRQRGRIDMLGLDEDDSPTIIEYKKSSKDNVINQGLFYLDWLVDHKGDFAIAVQKFLGKEVEIDWSNPRLILIAEGFSEYDKYAVNRIGANIELWTFRKYGEDLLYLDPIYLADTSRTPKRQRTIPSPKDIREIPVYTVGYHLDGKPETTQELYSELRERILWLSGEGEIIEKANKQYISFKHGKNFCEVWVQSGGLKLWLEIVLEDLYDPYQLARDVTNVGHWGTGDVEVNISDLSDIEKTMDLVEQSFMQTT